MWNVSQGLMQFCVLLKNDLEYVAQISRGVLCCREQQVSSDCSAVTCSLRRVHTTPNTMTNLSVSSVAVPTECLVCSELALLIHFFPCQHSIVCEGKFFCFFCTFFPPLSRSAMQPPCLDSHKSRSIELCVTWNNPSMTSTTLSLDRIAKATHDGHTLCWAPAGRPPGQCLWMPWVIQKEGQMFQFWLAVFYPSKPPEKDFPLLWLLLPVCISAVLMAACSNMSASL